MEGIQQLFIVREYNQANYQASTTSFTRIMLRVAWIRMVRRSGKPYRFSGSDSPSADDRTRRSCGGIGGLRLEINYPHPGGAGADAAFSEAAERAAEEQAVAGPIPVMVVKPSSVADVENAMTQVMEQEAAMTGQQEAEVAAPAPYKVKSPEQEMDESIAAIDKLEAEKTHYKYDMENVQRNYAA
uniref:Uncharacterized protein n=1 Tax=Toxoplasma gondii COUG TaxID=1074873 RepID=A0A2G8Y9K9_TOXGO|nr:hypothetical protein TGCOUG_225460 [Toxoplasma gondii COUG]